MSSFVFTSHDGFVAEMPMKGRRSWQEMWQEAYHAAMAQRAGAMYEAQMKAACEVPVPGAKCNKPAPVAKIEFVPHVIKLSDSALFGEVEPRGYEVAIP